ncbi:MAG: response regulator transcription factor [Chloroflexaceae bacterium]|jgi:DNA-binding response OmpR family regulator|nr:response regulator transcription factor [Chloroflexaceae bacterium]
MKRTLILIVDDDPAIRQGVTNILGQGGYVTVCAASGSEAVRLLEHTTPALVILDVLLPDLDGFSVCRAIRARPHYLPVLMLSARDEVLDRVNGLEVGADEYVVKPCDPRELLARVRAMLRFTAQRQPAENQPLVAGPLRCWLAARRLTIHEVEVSLTAKEWALLELFLAHPGQVLGRETLLHHVWGAAYLGESRCVDVLVQRLRAKLESAAPEVQAIQTLRGLGYRWQCA